MDDKKRSDRRRALSALSTGAMAVGVAAGYGGLAAIAGRFVYPSQRARRGWVLVAPTGELPVGSSVIYRTPAGATINVTRQGEAGEVADWIALSSTCPHLGCQVHWQPLENRFFCPCHNGVFTPDGIGIGGPPGDAGQNLPRYPLKVEDGLLFLEVSLEEAELGTGEVLEIRGPTSTAGHDPCLGCRRG